MGESKQVSKSCTHTHKIQKQAIQVKKARGWNVVEKHESFIVNEHYGPRMYRPRMQLAMMSGLESHSSVGRFPPSTSIVICGKPKWGGMHPNMVYIIVPRGVMRYIA